MLRSNNRTDKRRSRINIISDAYHDELHRHMHFLDLGLTLKILFVNGKPQHTWMLKNR